MPAFEIPPPDPRLYAVLAEAGFSDAIFNPRQHRSCELVERYALQLAIDIVGWLGIGDLLEHGATVDALLATRRFVPRFRVPLRWLLDRLALDGLIARDSGDRYRLVTPLPAPELDALRAEALASEPSYGPAFALLDAAAALYPAVARGEIEGEEVLFRRAALWFAYFSNANGYYAINNHVAAAAAATRVASGATVLEVGAGLGSATEALAERLQTLDVRLAGYRVTEPVPLFRRRAERTLGAAHPELRFAFSALDLNQPWAMQGVEPGSVDLVWGVNVFHLARDLDGVLREAHAALVPGGSLVIGEGLRPFRGQPVGAELPFQILASFVDVEVNPETRATPGFLASEEWLAALGRAGFVDPSLVPDAIRLRALHPGFFAAAICGRRPLSP